MVLQKSASPPLEHHCLLCLGNLKSSNQTTSLNLAENAEVLQDIFQVFSKYMEWDPSAEDKYDFHKDPFPFCDDCSLTVKGIYNCNENIQSLQKMIKQLVSSATAKVLNSDQQAGINASSDDLSPNSFYKIYKNITRSSGSPKKDERKIPSYYREVTLKHYSARVELTSDDTKQVKNYKQIVKSEKQDPSVDLGQNTNPVPMPSLDMLADHRTELQKSKSSVNGNTAWDYPPWCRTSGLSKWSHNGVRTHLIGIFRRGHPTPVRRQIRPRKTYFKAYSCKDCHTKYATVSSLTAHDHKRHSVACSFCGKWCKSLEFSTHLFEKHPAEMTLECEHCGSKFHHENSLRSHLNSWHKRNEHPPTKPWTSRVNTTTRPLKDDYIKNPLYK